jgi:Family of unknown function (DUF5677)
VRGEAASHRVDGRADLPYSEQLLGGGCGMSDGEPRLSAGSPKEWIDFEKRHPGFREALARLKTMLETAFLRAVDADDLTKFTIFGLGRLAVEDFFEILLLAVNGYGFGALKLLRPLYERVVTAVYLMRHPDEAQDFVDFAYVNQRKLLNHAKNSGVDVTKYATAEQLTELEAEYQRVTERLRRNYWSDKNVKVQADEVGLGDLYGMAAFWPTLHLHTTRAALDARLEVSADGAVFKAGAQRKEADQALGYAHILVVQILYACNEFFSWGLDMAGVLADVEGCWGDVGQARLGEELRWRA